MVALVAVDAAVYAIDKPYSYRIPSGMNVLPGMRVIVPFGQGNRHSEGIVLELSELDQSGLKTIESVLDQEPVLSADFLRLAAFLRERYFCTFYDAIKAMLPAGLWFDSSEVLERTEKSAATIKKRTDSADFWILTFVEDRGGTISLTDLKEQLTSASGEFSAEELDKALQKLRKNGYLRSNLDFSRKVKDKQEKIVALSVPAEDAIEIARKKQRSAPLQAEVLKLLSAVGSGSSKEICYLTGANHSVLRRLETLGLVSFSQREVFRTALPAYVEPAAPLLLNEEQQQVFDGLLNQSGQNKPGAALLYGVTGSGKTAVYIQLIQHMLELGKGSMLLVPEISLTPQLITKLMSYFGHNVAVLHSALRVSERYDEWKRILQGQAKVVIGTRSAVFAPVHNLGLIIVDEEQEHTYKSENNPRYHAREVALYRGSKEKALVVLGSATPAVETMYLAKSGVYHLYRLSGRFNGKQLPSVQIVDMKNEIRNGNSSDISRPLLDALLSRADNAEQSILFLNRRGAGRCMICVDCGHVPSCPRCSVSLTYHQVNGRRMCHYCGWSEPAADQCGTCGGHMKICGTGTQKLEIELEELMPETKILRMDADTISAVNNHEAILDRFRGEKIPVLIGTQMVTKGLNFENVTLVGVVDADMSLYVNQFRAAETTFSTITQVVGRAGRGEKPGMALIQTMTPEHAVLQLAANQDYDSFYDMEIALRRIHDCPPFKDLFTIHFSGPFEDVTANGAWDFRRNLEAMLKLPDYHDVSIEILGPSPAAVAKINNNYRVRLTLKCENTRLMRQILAHLLKTFSKDKRHNRISVFADINAYE